MCHCGISKAFILFSHLIRTKSPGGKMGDIIVPMVQKEKIGS